MINIGKYMPNTYLDSIMSEEEKTQAEHLYKMVRGKIENNIVFNTENVSDENIEKFCEFVKKIDHFDVVNACMSIIRTETSIPVILIGYNLLLIFRYNSCNLLAKAIMNESHTVVSCGIVSQQKNKSRRYEAKKFIQYCTENKQAIGKYKMVFWSLMILAVDQNNIEEHLALICNFVKLLHITEEEFEDILCLVEALYHNKGTKYIFKTETISNIFGKD